MTRRSYFLCASRVIRRQAGASLNFFRKWHLGDFDPQKCWIWEIWPFVWAGSICSQFLIVFNLNCKSQTSNLLFLARWKYRPRSTFFLRFLGQKIIKKWSFPNSFQIISGHFWSIQDIKNMILERFKLPENQKNYEKWENSKLAQKTSRYEGRSAESKTLSLFKMFCMVLRFSLKKDGRKPLGGCRERHKTNLSHQNSVFESNIFVCALLGAFAGIAMFFWMITTFFSLVLWDIAAGLLWAAAPLLVLFLLLLLLVDCWVRAATLSAAQPGSPCGLVWSGSTFSAALCAVLGFWSGDSSGCHFAAGPGCCSECCSGCYFGCDWC